MYEFWYDYVKPKCPEKSRQQKNQNTGSFTLYIRTEDIQVDIEKDVEKRSDTSNYELERPLPKGKK